MTWLGFASGLLQALARLVTPFLLWMGGKASQRAAQAEASLEAERDRQAIDRDVARLPDDDLDRELRDP